MTIQRATDGEIVGLTEDLLRNVRRRLEYQARQSTAQATRKTKQATRQAKLAARQSTIEQRAIEHAQADIRPYWGEYTEREPHRYEHSEYGLSCREYCTAFDRAISLGYVNTGARLPRDIGTLPEHRIP